MGVTKSLLFIAPLLLGIVQVTNAQTKTARQALEKKIAEIERTLEFSLGSELPGVQIGFHIIDYAVPIESAKRIRVDRNGRRKSLRGLNDLKGFLQISNEAAALKFVRLRNSPLTWYAWPGNNYEIEVINGSKIFQMPNYGYREIPSASGSGFLGQLSPRAFTQGGFEPPKIKRAEKGYIIERWIYCSQFQDTQQINERVRKIREFVVTDGGYSRVILKDKAPPVLPETEWRFMGFH